MRLLDEIRPMGYAGSIATVRRFLQGLKPERERLSKLTVRFETPPGKQAQADSLKRMRHDRFYSTASSSGRS